MDAIEIEGLYKSYDGASVLRGLDLRVPQGRVYGLLGPNGSGKSTLIHLLLGFLKPNRGTLRVFGQHDLALVRGRIGYLPERLRYHLRYTAREYLRYLGQFSDMGGPLLARRIDEELQAVGLADVADRILATFSKGMLQRLGIAQALLASPELLLIDEPTSGLDPGGQREMLTLLSELSRRNHTIFLATHVLDEIDLLCDTVGILYGGKLAAQVDVQSLRTPGRSALLKVASSTPELQAQLTRIAPAVRCNGREILLQPNSPALQAQVLRALLDADIPIISIEPQGRPLEEIYLRVVRGELAELAGLPNSSDGLFAPPGHRHAIAAERADQPDARPERRSNGDTLLRELLGRPENGDEPPGHAGS